MSLDHATLIERIGAILESVTDPSFTVFAGEPLGLAPDGSPYVCYWYLGDVPPSEGKMTFTNVMVLERIQIMCFWHRVLEMGSFVELERQIWNANRAIKAAFRADSTINNEATDLDITDSSVDYGAFPGSTQMAIYRTLQFELQIKSLEEESIAP